MQLICPACGCRASAEVWENDAAARQFVAVVAQLPRPVAERILRYCGLFRSPDAARAMAWKKALRIGQELADFVAAGYVQTKGKVARPCTPQLWGRGMDKMLELVSAGQLRLPMKNHNYLITIVWQEADKADAAQESLQAGRGGHLMTPQETAQLADRNVGIRQVKGETCGEEEPHISQFDRAYIEAHGREAWEKLGSGGDKTAFAVSLKKIPETRSGAASPEMENMLALPVGDRAAYLEQLTEGRTDGTQ